MASDAINASLQFVFYASRHLG